MAEPIGHGRGRVLRIAALSAIGLVVLVALFIYVLIPGFIAGVGIFGVLPHI